MEEEVYTVVIDGKPQGPYQLEELKTLGIKPGTFVRKPGMTDYKEAHEMPELRTYLGFNFEQVVPQYYASFDQRVVADIIDYLIITGAYLLILAPLYFFASLTVFRIAAIVAVFPINMIRYVYGAYAESSIKQATIGKRLLDIKVTDKNGGKLSFANALGRNFAKIISNFTLCIGYLYSFLNKKQQCLHDVIADTLVVKDRLI